jgi:hypothetical protein
LAVDDAPLPKIGDEIFDVGGAYFNDRTIAEMVEEGFSR